MEGGGCKKGSATCQHTERISMSINDVVEAHCFVDTRVN